MFHHTNFIKNGITQWHKVAVCSENCYWELVHHFARNISISFGKYTHALLYVSLVISSPHFKHDDRTHTQSLSNIFHVDMIHEYTETEKQILANKILVTSEMEIVIKEPFQGVSYFLFDFILFSQSKARYFYIRNQKHSPSTQNRVNKHVCNHAEMLREKLVSFTRSIIFATSLIFIFVWKISEALCFWCQFKIVVLELFVRNFNGKLICSSMHDLGLKSVLYFKVFPEIDSLFQDQSHYFLLN